MEFAIHQSLKIYSGGLGFLAGSHMRSAYELKQNFIGIGILWSYGYYDQEWDNTHKMRVGFREKHYHFLEDTGIKFDISIHASEVRVKVLYLAPETFESAPLFLLTTDIEENDHLSRTISYHLYDRHTEAKIAQCMLLGYGGAKLLDILNMNVEKYHINEAHGLSSAFHLYEKYNGKSEEIKKRLVFTTHTPEEAGNEKHEVSLLERMGFFGQVPLDKVEEWGCSSPDLFNHTLCALRLATKANSVSKLHYKVSKKMWGEFDNTCEIIPITNAQNERYWSDERMLEAWTKDKDTKMLKLKREFKSRLFEWIADECGKLLNPDYLTIVWARRFATYKRADLILRDLDRLLRVVNNDERPVQIIWAGKPYPFDYGAIDVFDKIASIARAHPRLVILTGYELALSKKLKMGSDLWLNTPIIGREASGTSGMTASMNATINFSTLDGWICEFAKDKQNCFLIPSSKDQKNHEVRDEDEANALYDVLESTILDCFYNDKDKWLGMMKASMKDVRADFKSKRMANQYYKELYGS